ncbi:MAG: peroxiredoxin-like family protein [Chryseolinea sp.]
MKLKLLTIAVMLLSLCVMAQEKPQGLKVNDKAPEFNAKDQFGQEISLKALLKKGPVVLMFYRGQWCPYCNKQLSGMQDSLEMVTSKGATVLAITPEKQENISKTIEKTKASFPILYDDGLKIMKSYQVAFQLNEASIEKFKGYGIDLNAANGSNGASLPVPALYIINKNGKITYRHFDPDYTKRPSVKEIASHL